MKALVALMVLIAGHALSARAESITIPLRELTAAPAMELRCISDARVIQLPVPERWAIRRAVLNLRYTVSNNLITETSQLVIKANGVPIAQTRLNAQAPDVSLGVAIPVELLEPGYNAITVQVAQHYSRKECEGPCSPDLWTAVNLRESSFQIDYALKPVPLEMSRLTGYIFDPRLLPHGEVHIVTDDLSAVSATMAGIVASGIARRFDYRKVKFSVSRDLKPGTDNVLIGKRRNVGEFLKKRGVALKNIEGGYLKILHLPGESGRSDPTRALLVVTGESDEAVRIAAETFANITFAFPGSDELTAFEFALPEIAQYTGREALKSERVYSLKTLNFQTQTFAGLNSVSRSISFRLPADFHIRPNQYAKLALNFSYGAGLKSGSSMNVSVNGRYVRAIPLDSTVGNFIDGYRIDIPTYIFKPGANTIDFTPSLQVSGQVCDLIQAEGLFVTLYENSTLQFPSMPHFVEMPKIELFMHNGFPFTRWPDGHDTTILLGAQDDRLLAAGLNLVGFASQRNGFPLFGVQFTYEKPSSGDMILVGLPESFPAEFADAAPLKIGTQISRVPYPVIRGWDTEATMAYSKQVGSLGAGRGLLMEFQSPYEAGRTVLMLTAGRADDVLAVSEALLNPDAQAKSQGDLVLIELAMSEAKISAMSVGSRYVTGKEGTFSVVESFLYTRPLVYYGVIGAAILLLSLAMFYALRRYRAKKRRLGAGSQDQ